MNSRDQRRADSVLALHKEAQLAKKKLLAAIARTGNAAAFAENFALVEPAANNPPIEDIVPQVVRVIFDTAKAFKAPLPMLRRLANGDYDLNLESDLRITPVGRENLSPRYTAISAQYPNGRTVGKIESKNATTVQLAIKRVHLRANGLS
ncbi:MAG: hypothetical protein QM755_22425 [Luteolibacter sp.]